MAFLVAYLAFLEAYLGFLVVRVIFDQVEVFLVDLDTILDYFVLDTVAVIDQPSDLWEVDLAVLVFLVEAILAVLVDLVVLAVLVFLVVAILAVPADLAVLADLVLDKD